MTSKSSHTTNTRAGRPRKFDRNDVISKAMHVFWSKGFSQTSIDDLVEGTNVGAQSLYNSLGNKREIFVQALELYLSTITQAALMRAENSESVIEGICAIFPLPSEIIKLDQPLGCLMVMSSFEAKSSDKGDVGIIIDKQRKLAVSAFTKALKCGKKAGEISASLNTVATAHLLTTLLQGAQNDIRYGATDHDIERLRKSIRQILQA